MYQRIFHFFCKNNAFLFTFARNFKWLKMLKRIKFTIFLVCFSISLCKLYAQTEKPFSAKLTTAAEYGYNYTWEHFGGVQAVGTFPLKSYFDVDAGIKLWSSNVYCVSLNTRTYFPTEKNEWRLETPYIYRIFARNEIYDLSGGLLLGFRRNHVNIGLGFFSRLVGETGKYTISNQQRFIIEPFNLLYSMEANLNKEKKDWEIYLRVSNHDQFQMERYQKLIFALKGRYSPKEKFYFWNEISFKPAGIFFLASNFYEFSTRLGITYLWQ